VFTTPVTKPGMNHDGSTVTLTTNHLVKSADVAVMGWWWEPQPN
jgi:hypothetical protein